MISADQSPTPEATRAPVQTFRYRVAPELRTLVEGFAASVWVATIVILRAPGVDAFQMVLCLPIASVVGFLALYFGRLTRFERIEWYADRIVWTDLWRRQHLLPLSEIRSIEMDRAFPFGVRYGVQGDGDRVRFYSLIGGTSQLLFKVRRALIDRRGDLPMSTLPWPGRAEYPFHRVNERWVPLAAITTFAFLVPILYVGGVSEGAILFLGCTLLFLLMPFIGFAYRRVVIEDGDLILRDGWREIVRAPVGALRSVTIDPHDRGGSTATFDTDGGSFSVNSTIVGYDGLVQAAQEVVRDRFRNLPEP